MSQPMVTDWEFLSESQRILEETFWGAAEKLWGKEPNLGAEVKLKRSSLVDH